VAGTSPGDRTVIHTLGGAPAAVRRGHQLTWDRTGRRAVSEFRDELFVFEGDRADPARTLALPGQIKSFAWNPADDRLAIRVGLNLWLWDTARPDPPVRVYASPSPLGLAPYHPCGGVAWHPDGRTLAFASLEAGGYAIRLIDPATRATLSKFPAMPLTVWALAWSPDGRRLAVAGDDPAVRVFDPATGRQVQSLGGHTFTVRALAYSPDGSRLASAGLDGSVMLWDAASGRLILSFELGGPVLGVAWSPDGTKLAALPETGVMKVWDAGASD
jgi:WD40 repeat protein